MVRKAIAISIMIEFLNHTNLVNGFLNHRTRSIVPKLGPSPSRKTTNVGSHPQAPQRGGRLVTSVDMKKKSGNRKYWRVTFLDFRLFFRRACEWEWWEGLHFLFSFHEMWYSCCKCRNNTCCLYLFVTKVLLTRKEKRIIYGIFFLPLLTHIFRFSPYRFYSSKHLDSYEIA